MPRSIIWRTCPIAIDHELAVFATTWTWPPRTVRTETVRGAIAVGFSRSRSVARNRGTAGRVVAAVGTIVTRVAVDRGIIAGIIDCRVLIRTGSDVECIRWIQQSQASLTPFSSQGDIAGRCSRFRCSGGCGCEVGGLGKGVLRLLLRYDEHTTLHAFFFKPLLTRFSKP